MIDLFSSNFTFLMIITLLKVLLIYYSYYTYFTYLHVQLYEASSVKFGLDTFNVQILIIIEMYSDHDSQIKSNQKKFIHTYKQVHSIYKSKVFKSIYIYTNTTIVDIMHSIYI